ncbi:MAG: tRNA (guanosine(37)-N1)-methyltransferase TrmD [Planctomycetota bacterium]
MKISILTLFPSAIEGYLGTSILGIGAAKGLVEFEVVDIRDFAEGRHKQVDDRPFGGGPGMLLMPGPVVDAVERVRKGQHPDTPTVLLTPQGKRFDQATAGEFAGLPGLILVCGRYEGFDERIREILNPVELSIGDFVLAGGEPAALAVTEAVVRLLPGVLGDEDSARDDSFTTGLLEGPQYTRPRNYRDREVPEVLISGDHERIALWRLQASRERTRARRADLIERQGG